MVVSLETKAFPLPSTSASGTGAYKLGVNYAPGIVPQSLAAQQGFEQNLWLLGDEHYLTEVGTMNIFVVLRKDPQSA